MRESAYSQLCLTGSRSLAGLSTGFPLWSDLTSSMGSGNGGYDYSLGTTLRNQMLELHFDADQDCFLGQPAGSETIITFAQKAADKN